MDRKYTKEDFKDYFVFKEAIEVGEEIEFSFNNTNYTLAIYEKTQNKKGNNKLRYLYNQLLDKVLIIESIETIFDSIKIDGKTLKEIWPNVILL